MRVRTVIAGLGLSLLLGIATISLHGQQPPPPASNPFAQLHFRFIGPTGNRAAAIAGEPGNPAVIYVGAASGGIWKSTLRGCCSRTAQRAPLAGAGRFRGRRCGTGVCQAPIRARTYCGFY